MGRVGFVISILSGRVHVTVLKIKIEIEINTLDLVTLYTLTHTPKHNIFFFWTFTKACYYTTLYPMSRYIKINIDGVVRLVAKFKGLDVVIWSLRLYSLESKVMVC